MNLPPNNKSPTSKRPNLLALAPPSNHGRLQCINSIPILRFSFCIYHKRLRIAECAPIYLNLCSWSETPGIRSFLFFPSDRLSL